MSGSNAIREFFDNYPGFSYNEASETMAQFYALCDLHGWERGSEEREEALDGIRNAIALRFNAVYGSDADSLDEWHNLFRRLKIFDIPSTVKDCKEISPSADLWPRSVSWSETKWWSWSSPGREEKQEVQSDAPEAEIVARY
ncbi:hypothetical protein F5880DRAFT_1508575 [Lentinula raphanica]|nr:hypothetical protein F5880DRAFT_1508575 [Lentinula raphanica]